MTFNQTTLQNPVSCSGIGLHSGSIVNLTIHPAEENAGISFRRTDVPRQMGTIPAHYDQVCDTRLGTTIRNEQGVTVSTIEHLMAAIWGVGIDNALVELDGPEVPIMDGSSEPFVFMLECAGLRTLKSPRRLLRLTRAVEVHEGDSFARAEPYEGVGDHMSLDIEIDFPHRLIARQQAHYDFHEVTFKQLIARARTFGFEHEVEALRGMGLALGGSLDNAIVVGKETILNEGGLRYADEFVRHKALDCLGDLFLAGHRFCAHFTFFRPGHNINNLLLRTLMADRKAWKLSADAPAAISAPLAATQPRLRQAAAF